MFHLKKLNIVRIVETEVQVKRLVDEGFKDITEEVKKIEGEIKSLATSDGKSEDITPQTDNKTDETKGKK